LKRLVTDLQKRLNSSWAAGLVPSGSELVPGLNVVHVAGDVSRPEEPDIICPIPAESSTRLAALVALGPKNDGSSYTGDDRHLADVICEHAGVLEEPDDATRELLDHLDHSPLQRVPGLEFGGQCHRSGRSGGDFFEILPGEGRSLGLAVGSVAARGLCGGIMLGAAVGAVRMLVNRGESVARVAVEVNRLLWDLAPEDSFTSFVCARIDPARGQLRYVNAGHEAALLLRGKSRQVDRLEPTGAVLGLSNRSVYRELSLTFEPGDLLAAFTDGVAEAAGPSEVTRILRDGQDCVVQDLAAQVLAAGETAADRTIVLVRSTDANVQPLPMEQFQLAAA
jgi:hypothetical protein